MTGKEQPEANKAVVKRFNKEFIEDDDENVFYEIIDETCVNHTSPEGVPGNAAGMLYVINEIFRKAFPDITVEIYEQVAENDLVVTRKAFHCTHAGPFMGVAATGKRVIIPVIDIVRLRNGKYTEHWGMPDMQFVMKQISS